MGIFKRRQRSGPEPNIRTGFGAMDAAIERALESIETYASSGMSRCTVSFNAADHPVRFSTAQAASLFTDHIQREGHGVVDVRIDEPTGVAHLVVVPRVTSTPLPAGTWATEPPAVPQPSAEEIRPGDTIHWRNVNNNRLLVREEGGTWRSRILYGDGAVYDSASGPDLDTVLEQSAMDVGPTPPSEVSEAFAAAHRRVWESSGNEFAARHRDETSRADP